MTIRIRHTGICTVCHGRVFRGTLADWERGGGIRHPGCARAARVAAAEADREARERSLVCPWCGGRHGCVNGEVCGGRRAVRVAGCRT